MDSVSQFVLGASVTALALGGRVPPRRAALWGGVLGTLPDLDILIDHGDAIANMVLHRGHSHALLWMTLLAPAFAFGIASLHRERPLFRRWWLAVWLAWITHALLDALTIYGTSLWLPFSDTPAAVGSLFVIDPLYTLPLLVGTTALLLGLTRARRWNVAGLVLSTAYAAWSLVAQAMVTAEVRRELHAQGIVAQHLVVTPAPFQTLLWRAVAIGDGRAVEGYHSVLDGDEPMRFDVIGRDDALLQRAAEAVPMVAALRRFAGDVVRATLDEDTLLVTDLRMGSEPSYVFTFEVATRAADASLAPLPAATRRPFERSGPRDLGWMWHRMWGAPMR